MKNLKQPKPLMSNFEFFSIAVISVFAICLTFAMIANIQKEGVNFEDGISETKQSETTEHQFTLAKEFNEPRLIETNENGSIYAVDSFPGQTFDVDFFFHTKAEGNFTHIRNMSQDVLKFESTMDNVELSNDHRIAFAKAGIPVPVKISVVVPETTQKVVEATLLERTGTTDEMSALNTEDINESNAKYIKFVINVR